MEQSPLTHQPRPEVFQHKIVRLYEALFNVSMLSDPSRAVRQVVLGRRCEVPQNLEERGWQGNFA
jgi:hypothetical protein